ncbi:MAG: class I SAM-dependent methyltransferase [Alphaproteobacteria bacterium]
MATAADPAKLEAFKARLMPELGGAASMVVAMLGDKTGLFKAMAGAGPLTSAELAARTGCAERMVREWLNALAAAGWIDCDPAIPSFTLTPEQALVFADDDSPDNLQGFFLSTASMIHDLDRIAEAFHSGRGVPWGDRHSCLFCGTERFFRPAYIANLVEHWIPAVVGLAERLRAGAKVADVGCGYGISTALMAEAFPNANFVGYDFHGPSIDRARETAAEAGLHNTRFEVAAAKGYAERDFDVIAFFDCLHDMGDPVGAMAHAHAALKPGGIVMLVEPFANDRLADNLTPVGRLYYSGSTCVCTPASMSQEVGAALGAQAGPARLRVVAQRAGFDDLSLATASAFNMVLHGRKAG